jgi:acetyl-CoA carboxylase carboxyltransferase component
MADPIEDDKAGGWDAMLADLDRRKREARAMGGALKLERRRATGRLNARERVDRLLDPGSFSELGTLVGGIREPGGPATPADALVAGMGRIEGRPVLVGSEDFTVMGGSIGPGAADKRYRLTQIAAQERLPLVMLLEGAGHRLTNALRPRGRGPNDLQGLAGLSGLVPTVCVVMGPSAGHGALTAPLMDFVVMVEGAALFSAGPPLVEAAIGQTVSKEELGGTAVHVDESGVAHNRATDDAAALDTVRRYLGFFPRSAWEAPPRRDGPDTQERRLDAILQLLPADDRRPYKMRRLLDLVCDEGSVLEIQPDHGRAMVTALAFLGGRAVAIVANDPATRGGSVDGPAAIKASRFLEVAGGFHLPVVFLADNPGVMAGTAAERDGALRWAARMFAAQHRLRVPKISVTLRKAFGFGSSIMAMNPFDDQTLSLALPGVSLGAMPARGGGAAAKVGEETQADLDAAEGGGPYSVANSMGFDEIIDPRDLRNALLRGLALASGRDVGPFAPVARFGALP